MSRRVRAGIEQLHIIAEAAVDDGDLPFDRSGRIEVRNWLLRIADDLDNRLNEEEEGTRR